MKGNATITQRESEIPAFNTQHYYIFNSLIFWCFHYNNKLLNLLQNHPIYLRCLSPPQTDTHIMQRQSWWGHIFVLHVRNAHFPVLRCDPAAQEVLCSCTTVPTLAAALNGRMSCLKFPPEALWQGSLTAGRIPSATNQGGTFGSSCNTVTMAVTKLCYCPAIILNSSQNELVS